MEISRNDLSKAASQPTRQPFCLVWYQHPFVECSVSSFYT
jgi:hypothetical protein